jgi:hypothetical protein
MSQLKFEIKLPADPSDIREWFLFELALMDIETIGDTGTRPILVYEATQGGPKRFIALINGSAIGRALLCTSEDRTEPLIRKDNYHMLPCEPNDDTPYAHVSKYQLFTMESVGRTIECYSMLYGDFTDPSMLKSVQRGSLAELTTFVQNSIPPKGGMSFFVYRYYFDNTAHQLLAKREEIDATLLRDAYAPIKAIATGNTNSNLATTDTIQYTYDVNGHPVVQLGVPIYQHGIVAVNQLQQVEERRRVARSYIKTSANQISADQISANQISSMMDDFSQLGIANRTDIAKQRLHDIRTQIQNEKLHNITRPIGAVTTSTLITSTNPVERITYGTSGAMLTTNVPAGVPSISTGNLETASTQATGIPSSILGTNTTPGVQYGLNLQSSAQQMAIPKNAHEAEALLASMQSGADRAAEIAKLGPPMF